MASRKKKQPGIVRCFEVSEPTLHPKGHTIYKVVQRVIKVDCPEADVQEVIVWRRYNDFKKLYKAMFKLHQALHRKDEFPPFVEGKVFGRFDDEVVKRRMLCGQDLLNFVGQRNYLVASRAYQQFFEGGEIHKFEGPPVLIPPAPPPKTIDDLDLDLEDFEDRSQPDGEDSVEVTAGADGFLKDPKGLPKVPSFNQLLGGVWRYRQIAEEISLGGDDDDEQTDYTDDSALSTPLPDSDLSFFDPLKPSEDGEATKPEFECSNEWLLSQKPSAEGSSADADEEDELKKLEEEFAACGIGGSVLLGSDQDSKTTSTSSSPLTVSVDLTDGLQEVDLDGSFGGESEPPYGAEPHTKARSGSVVERGKGDLLLSPVHKQSPGFNRPLHSLTSTPSGSPLHSAKGSPSRSPARHSLVSIEVKDKADYIFLAAHQISLAQQCEANANYHMAFSYYKSAVGIMLTGVQKDDNKTRREVVRKKTAKYLLKAEELYHLYLDSREKVYHGERWDTGKPSPAKELDPNVAFIQGSISELKSFKVLGVIDKVLLVIDTLSDQTFVIKVLHKSCSMSTTRRNIIPVHLPFMLQLHKFFETENAVFLLLQHASGGRLWNYVSGYMQQQQHNDAELENVLNDPHEKMLRTRTKTADSEETIKGSSAGVSDKSGSSVPDAACDKPEPSRLYTGPAAGDVVRIGHSGVRFIKSDDVDSDIGDNDRIPPSNVQNSTRPSSAKTFTELENREDGFSLDGNQDSTKPQKVIGDTRSSQRSTLRSSSSDVRTEEHDSVNADVGSHFEDILKGTKTKPSLEQFSINSFDSDCGPGSRYESVTSEHIESIPELSENSPHESPTAHRKSSALNSPGDVFTENSKSIQGAQCVINEATRELNDNILEKEMQNCLSSKSRTAIHDFADLELNHDLNIPKTVNGSHSTNSPDEETSIYDVYKPPEGESDVSSELELPSVPQTKPNNRSTDKGNRDLADKHAQNQPKTPDTAPRTPLTSPSKSLDSQSKFGIFRLPSQERSADNDRKPKKRHLSSMFGSFNIDEDKIKAVSHLPENCVKHWVAEMLVAISSLHSMGIICRDLQPHNILLGDRGHILLTYFSQWNCVDNCVDPTAVDLLYSAPEVGGVNRVSPACDWWSLGALLYELLTGKTISSCHPSGVTSHTQILIPDYLSDEAQALLRDLLKFHPEERLGAGSGGTDDIKMHPFFEGVDWTSLQAGVS